MKIRSKNIKVSVAGLIFAALLSCGESPENEAAHVEEGEEHVEEGGHAEVEEAMLSQQQFDALEMKIDTLQERNMSGFVQANGRLEVPPQNEATVTAVIGGNVTNIEVIEGDRVRKGQTLAYISHPEIIQLQTNFLKASNQLDLEEKEFERQKKLYEAGVGSGELFQKAEAELQNARGMAQGLRSQLALLNLSSERIREGQISQRIPIVSPIEGAVEEVNVKTGQFVQAQNSMFEIVNTEHVHADLMVFEQDVSKVEVGQTVKFEVESLPGTELTAKIISVSQTFEEEPKAVHVHAEIKDKPDKLIPGMYVRGRILIDETQMLALPQDAIGRDGENFFAFKAEREGDAWSFKPVPVIAGASDGEWIAINFMDNIESDALFAYNNAYYLMAQMQKGEGGHAH